MENKQSKFVWTTIVALGIMGFLSLFRVALTAVDSTTVWYDAAFGTTPDQQSMEFEESDGFSLSSDAEQFYIDGATTLSTTITMGDYAGYGILPENSPTLVAADGFKMTFTVQVTDETHNRAERSGFSVILLDNTAKGIELGFHENVIYAREGNGANLFGYAEDVAFDTTNKTVYELAILNNTYTLFASGSAILTGAIRDYSDNEPPLAIIPDPYEEPNFIFLGDNTTSASGVIRLWYVATTLGSVTPATVTPTVSVTGTATSTAMATGTATGTAVGTPTTPPIATETPDPGSGATPTAAVRLNLPVIIKQP